MKDWDVSYSCRHTMTAMYEGLRPERYYNIKDNKAI